MNTFLNPHYVPVAVPLNFDDYSGWDAVRTEAAGGAGSAAAVNMADAVSPPRSPEYTDKQRRLSRLLDKLTVQLQNNNHYPPPHWLMLDSKYLESTKETNNDVPLDLSIRSERNQPKVEETVQASFTCSTCGQSFSLHDRLTKHIASRHRGGRSSDAVRSFACDVCLRRFTRSDMLTRHARLHSGVKPYSCATCAQVFSRSDHLATHQRTHTGEKPYKCSVCPYAACRRDMITRHMRTHTRRSHPV